MELEFNVAQQLERPVLLFVMGEEHPVRKAAEKLGNELALKALWLVKERPTKVGEQQESTSTSAGEAWENQGFSG